MERSKVSNESRENLTLKSAANSNSHDSNVSATAASERPQRQEHATRAFVYVLTFLAAIGGFLFGYDTGVVSGAMLLIHDEFNLNNLWHEMIVSATILAAWIFSLCGGFLSDFCGRKPVILIASFVFTLGAVVMGVSNDKITLLIGRIIVGVGIGLGSSSVPVYLAETSSRRTPRKMVSLYVAMVACGQFAASVLAANFSHDRRNGWRPGVIHRPHVHS